MDQPITLEAILDAITEYMDLPRGPVIQIGRCQFCYLPGQKWNSLQRVGAAVFHMECAVQEVQAARRAVTDIGRFLQLAKLAGVTIEKKEVSDG